MLNLAIIGGGPSAACVVEAVACHIAPEIQVDITVFDPGPHLWRGWVFQPDGDEVLANVPMAEMSVRAWDQEHGNRWLREQGMSELATGTAVLPRRLVGRYLESSAAQAIATMQAMGSQVQVETKAVRHLTVTDGVMRVRGEGWESGPFDHAVMCLGGSRSYDHYRLSGAAGFVDSPYPLRQSLAEVPAHASVGVVGSGLTAIDVVMALRARGHQGPISLMSRKGCLPAVRRKPVHHELRHLTVSRLEELHKANGGLGFEDLLGLVNAELAEAGADIGRVEAGLASTTRTVERLRDDLGSALEDDDPGWTVLRDAMVACGQDAWYLLRNEDKAWIRASHETLMRNCCPMPPSNAQRLLTMFDSGQLEMLPGVRSIAPRAGGGFRVGAQRDIDVDVVVAASTPADREPAPEARPLLESLVSRGSAVPHPFGGVRVERTTSRLITWRGVPSDRLYGLGEITHGAYLFTFGMPVLAARAERIVGDIKKGLANGHVHVGHGKIPADAPAA